MQIVKYATHERYTAHYDNRAGSLKRTLTFMGYLREPESGGATALPQGDSSLREHDTSGRDTNLPEARSRHSILERQERRTDRGHA